MTSRRVLIRQGGPALLLGLLGGLWLAWPEPTFEGLTADEWAVEIRRDLDAFEAEHGVALAVTLVRGIAFHTMGSLKEIDVGQPQYGPSCDSLGALEAAGADAVPVVTGLVFHRDPEIRAAVACVLARWGETGALSDPGTARRCVGVLVGDASPLVRIGAIHALGEIGEQESAAAELVIATRDADPGVRRSACFCLSRLDVPTARKLQALRAALSDDSSGVRAGATAGLGRLSAGAAPAVPDLIRRLEDEDREVVEGSLEALGSIGAAAREAVPVLVAREDRLEWRVLRALSRIGDPGARDTLLEAVRTGDRNARQTALSGLGRLSREDRTLIEPIIDALANEDEEVRRHACWILSTLDPGPEAARARPLLEEVIRSETPIVRMMAAKAIARYGGDLEAGLAVIREVRRTGNKHDARFAAHVLRDLVPDARSAGSPTR